MEPYLVSQGLRRLAMGGLMLVHIQLAAFIIGALVIAVLAESMSVIWTRFRAELDRLARALAWVTVVVYSTGAVLAIVFVWTISQLWPPFWYAVMRINVWPMAMEAITFALTIGFLFPYWYLWRPLARFKAAHLALGVAAVTVVHLQQAMIDVMAAYLLTPTPNTEPLRVFLNPTAIPLDMHRTVGNISFAGFVLAGYAAIRALRDRGGDADRAYHDWLGGFALMLGVGFMYLQPAIGLFYLEEIRWNTPAALNVMMRGRLSSVFLLQTLLLSVIFFLALLYMVKQTRDVDRPAARWLRILLVLNALGGLLLVQPYVVGPSQYAPWLRWTNPLGSMQPWKYLALAVQSLTALGAVMLFLTSPVREVRLARLGRVNRSAQWTLVALGVLASGMMLLMGYIRESGRLPYLVHGRVRLDGPMALPPRPPEVAPAAPAPGEPASDSGGGSP